MNVNDSLMSGWRQWLNAAEAIVEAQVEINALHLAVGDQVGAGAKLIVHRQTHGIANGFSAILEIELVGMLRHVGAEFRIPAGERPAADDSRGEKGEG